MIDAPDWLIDIDRQGRCRGAQELYALRQLHREHPRTVEMLVADPGPITRDRLIAAKAALAAPDTAALPPVNAGVSAPAASLRSNTTALSDVPPQRPGDNLRQPTRSAPHVLADLDGAIVELVVDAVPCGAVR